MSQSLKNSGAWPAQLPIRIIQIYWLNPAAVGDTFTIVDDCGNTAATGRCENANQSQIFSPLKDYSSDITVSQISSGTLLVRLK